MNTVFHFVKLAIAVIAGVAAAVCVFVQPNLTLPLSALSIAFSVMPE